jgi:hypothetical protein
MFRVGWMARQNSLRTVCHRVVAGMSIVIRSFDQVAAKSAGLEEIEGVHVDEDGSLRDFFCFGVRDGAGEDVRQNGPAGTLQ